MATTADVPQTTGICVGAVVQASPHAWGAHYAEKVGAAKRFRGTVVEAGTELDVPESCPAPLSSREPVWRVRYDDDNRVWATPERFLKVAARLRSGDNAAPAPVAAPPPPAPAPATAEPRAPAWYVQRDHIALRVKTERTVARLLQSRKPDDAEWQRKVPQLAQRLEEELLRCARSFDEYGDERTLKPRLQALAVAMGRAHAVPRVGETPLARPDLEPPELPKAGHSKPEADLTPQQRFGSLGGKCAGSVGENKFLVEVAVDGRARCQLRTCKEPLKVGELRLGKRPPSLRHGHKPKVTWYHPECAMEAFRGCSKKSRVVKKVEDIDHGWDDLSDTNKAFIRSVVDNAAKSRAPRKITPPATDNAAKSRAPKYCSSCSKTKPAGDFIHPRTGKEGATCAECIIKRSAAAKRKAPVDTAATLQLHTTRLDDHEQRIACVEEAVYEDAPLGAPSAPDASTFTKSQLRRQRRKNKKAGRAAARALDFVLVGSDVASDSTDLDSLASTHSCVRALVEENKQLSAGLRGMRLLLRDPSARLVQRVGRGMMGRRRAKCKVAAVVKIQKIVRGLHCVALRRKSLRAFTKLQGRERVRMARRVCHHKRCIRSSIVIGAAWRRYRVLSTTLFGKLLSKTRRLAKELTKANERLAANERALKNAVHASLCDPVDPVSADGLVLEKYANPFTNVLSNILRNIQNMKIQGYSSCTRKIKATVAEIIAQDLKVEITGATLFKHYCSDYRNSEEGQKWLSEYRDKKIPGIIRYESNSQYRTYEGNSQYYRFYESKDAVGYMDRPVPAHPCILSAGQFHIM